MFDLSKFKIEMFADGADLDGIRYLRTNPLVKGFTTNPTLMKAAGVKDYLAFAIEAIRIVNPLPISLEVFEDDLSEMKRQALLLKNLGENVYVKIPVTNTKGQNTFALIKELSSEKVNLNITAVFTIKQVAGILENLDLKSNAIISIFAGRIADSGISPIPIIENALSLARKYENVKMLWASPREIYNLIEANNANCHIITMTPELWKKIDNLGKDLETYSLETVQMFFNDAKSSGFTL